MKNVTDSTEIRTIEIEDNTIYNCHECNHQRGKSWVAIVEKDKSQPGGLKRMFLRRAPGGRAFLEGVVPGVWLEFAGDYYTGSGHKQAKRHYYRVLEVNGELKMVPCAVEEIGKMVEAEPVNPLATYTDDEILAEAKRRGLI